MWSMSFWRQEIEHGVWDRIDVSDSRTFLNGEEADEFDFEKAYNDAFAVMRPWVIGPEREVFKPRESFRSVAKRFGIELEVING